MNPTEKEIYYKGYVAGYRAGMNDAADGKTIDDYNNCAEDIPIQAAKLSTRAKHCLIFYGCKNLHDAAAFSADRIKHMRNLGVKTAAEIAAYLDSLGIRYSAWNAYL